MMDRKTISLARLCVMILTLAMSLPMTSAVRPEPAAPRGSNPCSTLPQVCRYTWDPVEKCCVADPRFDCYDVCYSAAEVPASCADEPADIRYCCTPQQVSACTAEGGTTSCRTNVCQCLF